MSEKLYALTINVDNIDKGTFITVPELQATLDEWETDGQWDFHAMQRGVDLYIQARRLGNHNEEPPFGFDWWQTRNIFNYRVVVGQRVYRCPAYPHVPDCGFGDMRAHARIQANEYVTRGYSRPLVWAEGDHIYIDSKFYAYAIFKDNRR